MPVVLKSHCLQLYLLSPTNLPYISHVVCRCILPVICTVRPEAKDCIRCFPMCFSLAALLRYHCQ